jgi:hypothetical protein
MTIDRHRIALALTGLTIGTLVYLTARSSTTYVAWPFHGLPLPQMKAGLIAGCLPTFCHMFAFSLISGELLRPWAWAARASFVAWALLETAVEIGQSKAIALAIQSKLKSSSGDAFSGLIADYFVRSTFDYFDLLAVALGGIAAWLVYASTADEESR